MGAAVKKLVGRFFDYPIKKKPICFYRQEDYSTTGEPRRSSKMTVTDTEYENLVRTFYETLQAKRGATNFRQEQNRIESLNNLLKLYPGWNELTITNLHSTFFTFDGHEDGSLNFEDVLCLLDSLGDASPYDKRWKKFLEADEDGNGKIHYDEFLRMVYRFDSSSGGNLQGLAKLCMELAEKVRFVNSLTVGEQLEYGLF